MQRGVEFTPYLGLPYKFEHYPIVSAEQKQEGLNCITLVHDIYREQFGVTLPQGMWAKEIYEDEAFAFRTVGADECYQVGDIFVFGPNYEQVYKLHLAMFTGFVDEQGEPLLIHATMFGGESGIWPLAQFAQQEKYKRVYGVKRLQPDLFDVVIKPLI